MTKQSNFDFFQKNKIEGLQHIVGGMNATVVTGGNRPDLVGHGDTWYNSNEGQQTSNWSDLDGGNKGDLVVAIATPQGPGYMDAPVGTQYQRID